MAKSRRNRDTAPVQSPLIFGQRNYMWLTIGVLCIIFGFTAMRMENEIRGVISLYISPIVILAGFGITAWAILLKSDDGKTPDSPTSSN